MKKRSIRPARLGHARLAPPDESSVPYGDADADVPAATKGGPICAPGVPEATVQMCLKRKTKEPGKQIGNHIDACKFVRGMATAAQENFLVLHLDTRHRILGVDLAGKGTLSGVEVHPREVFKAAILNNASGILLAHNHPSGDPNPGPQDRELTKRLQEVGALLGISVLDHVIVGAEGCRSLAALHLMGNAESPYSKPGPEWDVFKPKKGE